MTLYIEEKRTNLRSKKIIPQNQAKRNGLVSLVVPVVEAVVFSAAGFLLELLHDLSASPAEPASRNKSSASAGVELWKPHDLSRPTA